MTPQLDATSETLMKDAVIRRRLIDYVLAVRRLHTLRSTFIHISQRVHDLGLMDGCPSPKEQQCELHMILAGLRVTDDVLRSQDEITVYIDHETCSAQ